MDAVLGAAALGDIGKHFPDTDPAYAGADSLQLAQHVARIMREKGWKIVNIDSTCSARSPSWPPTSPPCGKICRSLRDAGGCCERQGHHRGASGFTGEGLGIAAHAVA